MEIMAVGLIVTVITAALGPRGIDVPREALIVGSTLVNHGSLVGVPTADTLTQGGFRARPAGIVGNNIDDTAR